MPSEHVTFAGHDGAELSGRLELPEGSFDGAAGGTGAGGREGACAVLAHCFTCSKDVFAAARISRGLAERGIAVLRFDFTGLGGSEGEFADTTFSSNVGDLVAAADFMRARGRAPAIMIGHSLGGAAVLRAAQRVAECRAVCTIAAPAEPDHVRQLLRAGEAEFATHGEATVDIGGRPFRLKQEFLDDLERQSGAEAARTLGRALLIFHSPSDRTVGIENAGRLYAAARHPKSFVALDGANHLLTDRRDAEFVAGVIAVWAERYFAD